MKLPDFALLHLNTSAVDDLYLVYLQGLSGNARPPHGGIETIQSDPTGALGQAITLQDRNAETPLKIALLLWREIRRRGAQELELQRSSPRRLVRRAIEDCHMTWNELDKTDLSVFDILPERLRIE
jgi:hypothetical protein